MLVVGIALLAGVVVAFAATRTKVPLLIGFLGLGMLLGSEGPGGIAFDDPELARTVGIAALAAILYEGGLTTAWRDVRSVLVPASLLATLGVAITAAITGVAAYALFDVSMTTALLIGAIVGSTDAAAVFLTLRGTSLRRRTAALLEVESGINDPMAVALTIGLISVLTASDYGGGDFVIFLLQQLGLGAIVGLLVGAVAAWGITRAPASMSAFASVASVGVAALSFGAADVVGGSGFLAIYLVGLRLGNTPNAFRGALAAFHQGLAYMAQVALFVVLGLLVFPSELGPVAVPGLILAAVLILLARPLAVVLTLVGQRFGAREQALLSWAGLRGAVPIVLATFPPTEGVADSDTIFNAVFFVVIASALIQGPTLEPVARWLRLTTEEGPLYRPPLEAGPSRARTSSSTSSARATRSPGAASASSSCPGPPSSRWSCARAKRSRRAGGPSWRPGTGST